MNNRLLLAILLPAFFVCTHLNGQTQLPINYQAVIRDASGNLIKNQPVTLQFSFFDVVQGATPAYVEQHTVTTTELGYVHLELGSGDAQLGLFEDVSWKEKEVTLAIELNTGNGWTSLGTNPFNAVPFAYAADQAAKATNVFLDELKDVNAKNPTLGYILRWNGESWSPSKDADVQTLQLEGNILRISNGNEVTLPSSGTTLDAGPGIAIQNNSIVNTGDHDPTDDVTHDTEAGGMLSGTFSDLTVLNNVITSDHIQDGSLQLSDFGQMGAGNGQTLKWSQSNQSWVPADDEAGNKQTLSLSGTTLTISDGNSVNLPGQTNYAPGQGISIQGVNIINTGDVDGTDDLLKSTTFTGDVTGTYNSIILMNGAVT
ncbi:MAG: hypothetical protein KDC24_13900, partial [Saprospiraceae bacterium]|nr:hypothetical protein [Saprospiraceae bacterium]